MKKILILFLCLFLIGCGSKNNVEDNYFENQEKTNCTKK